jgi:NitT/TauT family transport system substrate-binding protein
MKKTLILIIVVLLAIGAALTFWKSGFRKPSAKEQASGAREKVVINEAARTVLYLPLYYAMEKGYFREAGADVQIVTGGTATASFAAMLSGEAQFSQADPMYVPIAREKGGQAKVVAQVVGRIAVWGLTLDPNVKDMSAAALRGTKIATHPRPMTAFTYTEKWIKGQGLDPEKDVEIITSTPGTEIAPLLNHQAQFMMTVEPNVEVAVKQGARVILSLPQIYGDQIFSGLMTTEKYINEHHNLVAGIVQAYQRALNEIRANPESTASVVKSYFPQLEDELLHAALRRMSDDEVIPKSVLVSEDSWNKANAVRVAAGDLKSPSSRSDSCDLLIMQDANK